MAFLDNSGDIILDAVLTDAGRERLAKGDGSFKITKFALGDDEINYELYRNANSPSGADSRGSAFYDLEILQSPVLEAFTNNTSSMKSKLITITRTDLLYLPVMKLYSGGTGQAISEVTNLEGTIPVSVNDSTTAALSESGAATITSTTSGTTTTALFYDAAAASSVAIEVDQGIDNSNFPAGAGKIPSDLFETSYSIQVDNRLMSLTDGSGTSLDVSFVDDDQIALYTVSFVEGSDAPVQNISDTTSSTESSILGARGTRVKMGLKATTDASTSDYLFTRLGGELTITGVTGTVKFIDTNIRITGITTGYRVDIPIRLLRS